MKRWAEFAPKLFERQPHFEDVVAYLRAFYHGLPVKVLNLPELRFIPWKPEDTTNAREIALCTGSEAIRIRTRNSEPYMKQMNPNDLLDVAVDILPKDAYALLMILPYDLYEDDNDDFCCGRAYGASRVAVVSSARYNPRLDMKHGVERAHAWPASHCKEYIDACCTTKKKRKITHSTDDPRQGDGTAMSAALAAHKSQYSPAHGDSLEPTEQLRTLWLGRVCKTASHELGHCFALDHCVYYACIMQGTANMLEDARQPPYLCPVDTAKLLKATGATEKEWCLALREHCDRFNTDAMFAAFAAWLHVRLDELTRDP